MCIKYLYPLDFILIEQGNKFDVLSIIESSNNLHIVVLEGCVYPILERTQFSYAPILERTQFSGAPILDRTQFSNATSSRT